MSKRKLSPSNFGQRGLEVADFSFINDMLRQLVVHMNQMKYGPGRHFWKACTLSIQTNDIP